MAIVYSPNIIEIAVHHTYNGKDAVNVWHMWFDAEFGTDTKTAVVRDFANNWQDHMMGLMNFSATVTRFDWRSLDDGELGTLAPDPAKDTTGGTGAATSGMSPNVALLVHKVTSDRERGQRDGRSFLVGADESVTLPNGSLEPTYVTAAQALLDSFLSGVSDISGGGAGDRYPAVLNTTPASRAPGSTPVTISSRRVTALTIDPVVSTQRDRLR